jgi:hypothetical protein
MRAGTPLASPSMTAGSAKHNWPVSDRHRHRPADRVLAAVAERAAHPEGGLHWRNWTLSAIHEPDTRSWVVGEDSLLRDALLNEEILARRERAVECVGK